MIDLFRQYLPTYRWPLVLVLILLSIQAIANLFLPELNADIINNGVVKGDIGYILRTGGFMLIVTGILGVAAVIGVYWSAKVSMAFGRDVRSGIFRKVETFSQVEVNTFGAASLITRNTNDVQQVQQVLLLALTQMISAPILVVGGLIMALRQDVPLSGVLLVIIPIMIALIGTVMYKAIPLFRALQKKIDRINLVMRETLSGVRVIRAFVRTRDEEARFDEASLDLMDTGLRVNRLFAITLPALMLIMNLSTVAVLWLGAYRVNSGEMPIGNLTAFLQYISLILFSIMTAVILFVMVPRGQVSGARIQEVLETEPTIWDPPTPISPIRRGHVEFRDVEFRYPGAEEPVLRHISFEANPGETTAIVGSTGSGKSTLINLLPRFYDATGGAVAHRRGRRQGHGPPGPVVPDRHRAPEGVPVRRHDRQQPALRRPGRRPTTTCGARSRSRRAASSSRRWRPGSTARSPRAAPTCRAASASGSRSRARWSRSPTSTSSTTASRRSTSGPTRGCAPRSGGSWATRR